MRESKQTIIIILLCINLVLILHFGQPIKNKFDQHAYQFSDIQNRLHYLEQNIIQGFKNTLESQDNVVLRTDYSYETIDGDAKKAVLQFVTELKAVSPNAAVYMALYEDNQRHPQEIELTRGAGLSFSGELELSLNKNYQYNLFERSEGGGEAMLNTQSYRLPLYDEFYAHRIQPHGSGASWNNQRMEKSFDFSIKDFGITGFGLDTATLEILYDGVLLDHMDITHALMLADSRQMLDHYNIALASGQISNDTTFDEFIIYEGIEYSDNMDGRIHYTYSHTIQSGDYEVPHNDMDFERLKWKILVNCLDGHTMELEF